MAHPFELVQLGDVGEVADITSSAAGVRAGRVWDESGHRWRTLLSSVADSTSGSVAAVDRSPRTLHYSADVTGRRRW